MLRVAVINDYMRIVREVADWSRLGREAEVTFFHDHLDTEDAIAERLAPFDIVVSERERTHFTASLLARLPKLKLLCVTGTDNWAVDFDATRRQGITVCNTASVMAAMPELAWGLILALTRGIVRDDRAIKAGGWQTRPTVPLQGKTLGILGLGIAGKRMLDIAHAFRMKTVAWSQNLTSEAAEAAGTRRVALDELLASSDVVTIQLVLSDRTRGLLGDRELRLMKPGAFLVNTSRGPIVQEQALVAALQEGRIGGAGLDVFDVEPLPKQHPLRSLDNVVLTPHTGYITDEQFRVFYGESLENILAYLAGSPIRVMTAPYSLEAKQRMAESAPPA
ncbi:D-2-hydroxyacid dehydrogenase family protein [Ramlibacter sp.]|uniref:D-2-hydroxyacid dehydrogenase family protein n=1 Tax=Ramlibacter sp. TaxID=1917967 RepID=UPI003D096268